MCLTHLWIFSKSRTARITTPRLLKSIRTISLLFSSCIAKCLWHKHLRLDFIIIIRSFCSTTAATWTAFKSNFVCWSSRTGFKLDVVWLRDQILLWKANTVGSGNITFCFHLLLIHFLLWKLATITIGCSNIMFCFQILLFIHLVYLIHLLSSFRLWLCTLQTFFYSSTSEIRKTVLIKIILLLMLLCLRIVVIIIIICLNSICTLKINMDID